MFEYVYSAGVSLTAKFVRTYFWYAHFSFILWIPLLCNDNIGIVALFYLRNNNVTIPTLSSYRSTGKLLSL